MVPSSADCVAPTAAYATRPLSAASQGAGGQRQSARLIFGQPQPHPAGARLPQQPGKLSIAGLSRLACCSPCLACTRPAPRSAI